MTASEILADNLRRLMNGKTVGAWTAENPTINNYYDHQWMLNLLEGATPLTSLETLDNIAAYAGVAPWQLLAPLCGKWRWDESINEDHPGGDLCTLGSGLYLAHTCKTEDGQWKAILDDKLLKLCATDAEARATIEAELFTRGYTLRR